MSDLEPITFFIDRCLGKRQIADTLRQAGATVEIHDDHFEQAAQDIEWLPEIGKRNWVVLTKDSRIGKRHLERIAVARANVKMFVLASQNLSGTEMAEIFANAIGKMETFANKHNPPFIAKLYRDGRIELWKGDRQLLEEVERSIDDP